MARGMQVDGAFLGFWWKWPQGATGEQPEVAANRRNRQLEGASQLLSVMGNTVSALPFAFQAALCSGIAKFLTLKWYLGNTDAITSNLPSCYLMHVNMTKQHSEINWKARLRSALILTECRFWSQKGCCTHNIWAIACPIWSRCFYLFIYFIYFPNEKHLQL